MITESRRYSPSEKPQSPADKIINAINKAQTPESLEEVTDAVISNATLLEHHLDDTREGEVVFRAANPDQEYPEIEMTFEDPQDEAEYRSLVEDLRLPIELAIKSTAERIEDGDEGIHAIDIDGAITPQEELTQIVQGIARGVIESSHIATDNPNIKSEGGVLRIQKPNGDWYVIKQEVYDSMMKQTVLEVVKEPGVVDAAKRNLAVVGRIGARIYKRFLNKLLNTVGVKDEVTIETEEKDNLDSQVLDGITKVEWDEEL